MSARLARTTFATTVRRAQSLPSSAVRASRRMASTASHEPTKKSDTPWLVGSLLVFGPAFLYLVSPSARKNTEFVHKDKHDFPALLNDEHSKVLENKGSAQAPDAQPELMKDDEGNAADVASSVALSQSSDVPQNAQSASGQAAWKAAADKDGSKPNEAPQEDKSAPSGDDDNSVKPGTFKPEGEGGPTNMGKAREAAKGGEEPKKAAEKKN